MNPILAKRIENPIIGEFGKGGKDIGADILAQMIANALKVVFIIAGLYLMTMLIWGGYNWMTAGGDKNKLETAHNRITQALIGFIIFMSVFAIINYLLPALGIEWQILVIEWPTPGP